MEGWRQTTIHLELYRSEHNQNQTLACKKILILALVPQRRVPHFSCRGAEHWQVGLGGGRNAASFVLLSASQLLLGVKQPVEEDRSINFIAGLISVIN